MGDGELGFGDDLAQAFAHAVEVFHSGDDAEDLAAAEALALHRLANDETVIGHDEGADRQAVDGRGGDQAHLAHAGQGELECPGDRGGAQREDVDVVAQRFELFLVGDAEMLLLVDDQQAELGELDALGEQGVGAYDDVDGAFGEALLDVGGVAGVDHARELFDAYVQPAEAGCEGAVVLPGEQGGRDDDGDLNARHGGHERGAECDLGLAEADVAADQAVHGTAGGEILEHVGDGA